MPEIFSPALFTEETEFKMRDAEKKGDRSSNTKAQILKEDDNYVGEGGRVVVAATEIDPDKLVAISMKETTPEVAKTVYYNQKLLKTLFPYNFPHIYASWGKLDGKGTSVNFRERVEGRSFTKEEAQKAHRGNQVTSANDPFYKVIDTMEKLEIPIRFDHNERNYMVSAYGDEVFVDTINYKEWTKNQKERVMNYMQAQKYSDQDIKIASMCLDRLLVVNASE